MVGQRGAGIAYVSLVVVAEFARRSARVLLLDGADRLLLVRSALVPGHPERGHYGGHHWWTQAELAATSETIYPHGLPALVDELIAGRFPPSPIALPWQ
jgi:hypothetical protein